MMRLARRLLHKPKLSVVVVVYDMGREAPRTLRSLSTSYQTGIDEYDYEVIVVDNGSPMPLDESLVRSFGRQFRYYYIENASSSPAAAVNFGVQQSRGKFISIMVDGARIVTPGLLKFTLLAFEIYDHPTVTALGWHLGPDRQQKSMLEGYSKQIEDDLLKKIGWPQLGYQLYTIAALGGSSKDGCFSEISESNTIGVSKRTFEELNGYDTKFELPGGGLVNLDFYKRAAERPDTNLVCLIGEGSFHQIHGGASTGITSDQLRAKSAQWIANYKEIRGVAFSAPRKPSEYLGMISNEVISHIGWSANHRLELVAEAKRLKSLQAVD